MQWFPSKKVLASGRLVKHRVEGFGGALALVFGVLLMAGIEVSKSKLFINPDKFYSWQLSSF